MDNKKLKNFRTPFSAREERRGQVWAIFAFTAFGKGKTGIAQIVINRPKRGLGPVGPHHKGEGSKVLTICQAKKLHAIGVSKQSITSKQYPLVIYMTLYTLQHG